MFDKFKELTNRLTEAIAQWSSVGVVIKGDRVFVDGKELLRTAKARELKRMHAFFTEMETAMQAMDDAIDNMDAVVLDFADQKKHQPPDKDDVVE